MTLRDGFIYGGTRQEILNKTSICSYLHFQNFVHISILSKNFIVQKHIQIKIRIYGVQREAPKLDNRTMSFTF